MNKDKDLIDACDKKSKRPVNLTGYLFTLRSDVEMAGEANHTHGQTDGDACVRMVYER